MLVCVAWAGSAHGVTVWRSNKHWPARAVQRHARAKACTCPCWWCDGTARRATQSCMARSHEAARFATAHFSPPGAALRPGCEHCPPTQLPYCLQDVMSANPIACKASDKATAAAHAMIDVRPVFVSSPFGCSLLGFCFVTGRLASVAICVHSGRQTDPVIPLLSRRQPPRRERCLSTPSPCSPAPLIPRTMRHKPPCVLTTCSPLPRPPHPTLPASSTHRHPPCTLPPRPAAQVPPRAGRG